MVRRTTAAAAGAEAGAAEVTAVAHESNPGENHCRYRFMKSSSTSTAALVVLNRLYLRVIVDTKDTRVLVRILQENVSSRKMYPLLAIFSSGKTKV